MSEVWKTIPGYSEDYEVSDLGRVRSYRAHGGKRRKEVPHLLTVKPNLHGYLMVGLQVAKKQRHVNVHTLVAAAFIGPRPDGYEVAHFDGDRSNGRLENLRYATRLENAADKTRHGTMARHEANGRAKLTVAQVAQIRDRYGAGEFQASLAEAFGISQSQVSNIVRGAHWSLDAASEAVS